MAEKFNNNRQDAVIAFQGELGAYSHLACKEARPNMTPLPRATFEDTFQAVTDGDADLAMIAVENSIAGRVADNHHLLPGSGLHIIDEHFQPVNHKLLGLPDADISDLKDVYSHVHALGQCRTLLRKLGVKAHVHADTAGAAQFVSQQTERSKGALASSLAADIYGLKVLVENAEDAAHNTTRFLLMTREPVVPPVDTPTMMTFVFQVRNVPAALYKAMGGFATNGVNMTKLESYQLDGSFQATQFYADIEGHPDDSSVKLAMEELNFYSSKVTLLGAYPKSDFRESTAA
ncbi:MAG: prephenate dehydratase [Proteobacteria bacterium]|jgi:prephenate dehydratase|nr:prephenate dehydratase [Pseudomonadota bacterium]